MRIQLKSQFLLNSLPVRLANRLFKVSPPLVHDLYNYYNKIGNNNIFKVGEEGICQVELPENYQGDYDFPKHSKWELPARYLFQIDGANLVGTDGIVVLPDGSFCIQSTLEKRLQGNPCYDFLFQKKPTELTGCYFSLHVPYCLSYYHWVHDLLCGLEGVLITFPRM